MKMQYNQPEVQVTEIRSMVVMQAVSAPAGDSFGISNIETSTQW